MKTTSEFSASHCRYLLTEEEGTQSHMLVVGNCHLDLVEEERFQVLQVLRKDGEREHHDIYKKFMLGTREGSWVLRKDSEREHHDIYRKFMLGTREVSWAVEIEHPEAAMWAARLQGFRGILQLLIPVVKPYEQCDTYAHRAFRVSAEDNVLRLEPKEEVPFHPVIREQDNLHGFIREIVRGTRLRIATTLDKDEWVAGVFRVWDGLYLGNTAIGVAPTAAEAFDKLDEHIKKCLDDASRTCGYTDEEKAAFRELHANWVTPQPSGEWPP